MQNMHKIKQECGNSKQEKNKTDQNKPFRNKLQHS